MSKLAFVVLFLSCVRVFAFETFPSIVPMPESALKNKTDVVVASNLPEVRSQDGLPICAGSAAWTLYMQNKCRKSNADCKSLNPESTPSILSVAGIGLDAKSYQKLKSVKVIPYHSSSNDHKALDAILGLDTLPAESCFPLDQFVQKYGGDNKLMVKAFKRIEHEYFDKNKSEGGICVDCLLKDLKADLGVVTDQKAIAEALQEDVFDKFLYDVVLKDCKIKVPLDEYKLVMWPTSDEKYSYKKFISKTKELLNKNMPPSSSFCVIEKSTGHEACQGHTFVISGYSKVCDYGGKSCKDYIKVHNSWGQDWQNQNSDGWIDAQNYYEYMAKDEPMTWIY